MAVGLGLLTGLSAAPAPWFTSYEVLESMPWRPRRVAAWLARRDAGLVEVKTRGGAVNPEEARKKLRGKGGRPFIVFVLRAGSSSRLSVSRLRGGEDPRGFFARWWEVVSVYCNLCREAGCRRPPRRCSRVKGVK